MANKKKKNNTLWVAIASGALVILLILLYIFFFSAPDIEIETEREKAGAAGSLEVSFPTKLFDDARMKQLKQFGSAEVQVNQRGKKENPFEAF